MKKSLIVVFVLLGQSQLLIAQTNLEKIITGIVSSDSTKLEGISIINCSNKKFTVTDKEGCFSIEAKVGDILNFSGIDYENYRQVVYTHDYNSGIIDVNMIIKAYALDEVIVNKDSDISAKNFGLIPKDFKRFTPQERKLYSSQGGIEGLYSVLSGERRTLKMNIEVEKKEMSLKKLEYLFGDKYYTETLKIPEEFIKGFQYYCVEDNEFLKYLSLKDKTKIMFIMTGLATTYNQRRLGK